MSFRQLLFSLFHGGDQREKSENPRNLPKWHRSYQTWPHYDQALYKNILRGMSVHQKLAIILENKVVQKLSLEKKNLTINGLLATGMDGTLPH